MMEYKQVGSHGFWQDRVKVLAEPMIRAKMRQDGYPRYMCEEAFFNWLSSQLNIEVYSFSILTKDQCKNAVAILHRIESYAKK